MSVVAEVAVFGFKLFSLLVDRNVPVLSVITCFKQYSHNIYLCRGPAMITNQNMITYINYDGNVTYSKLLIFVLAFVSSLLTQYRTQIRSFIKIGSYVR